MHQMPSNTNLSWEIYQNCIIASNPPCSKYTANKPIRSVGASFFLQVHKVTMNLGHLVIISLSQSKCIMTVHL